MSRVHDDLVLELKRYPRSLRQLAGLMRYYGHDHNDATISARIRDLRKEKVRQAQRRADQER